MVSTGALCPGQIGIDIQIKPRRALLDPTKHEMLDRIVPDGPVAESVFDGAMDMDHLEGLQQAQNLDVLALALLSHPRFQQPVQGGELSGQVPAFEWGGLIQYPDLLLQQRQVVHRIEHHVGLLVGPAVAGDHLCAAAPSH